MARMGAYKTPHWYAWHVLTQTLLQYLLQQALTAFQQLALLLEQGKNWALSQGASSQGFTPKINVLLIIPFFQ